LSIVTFLNVTYQDGLAPPVWQSHVGSCLVARKYKKPLSVEYLEAVWIYIGRLMDLLAEDEPKIAPKDINKKDDEDWFENYKGNNVENGRSEWKNVGSFYEL
jgi:hypothetical protein